MAEQENKQKTNFWVRSTKECAYFAVFLAILFAVQFAFSSVVGIELISVLFITYAYVFGIRRSIFVSVVYSLARCLLYGFFPQVLVLYVVHFSLLCLIFGAMGKSKAGLVKCVIISIIATVGFTLLDDVITPLFYQFSLAVFKTYFIASLLPMLIHCACVGASVAVLFKPLTKAFNIAKNL